MSGDYYQGRRKMKITGVKPNVGDPLVIEQKAYVYYIIIADFSALKNWINILYVCSECLA